jgi:hypothetical protein
VFELNYFNLIYCNCNVFTCCDISAEICKVFGVYQVQQHVKLAGTVEVDCLYLCIKWQSTGTTPFWINFHQNMLKGSI